MITTKTKYAARWTASGLFACEGHETGMGKAIVSTPNVLDARLSDSPAGLMYWLGGHYRGSVAVPVTIEQRVDVGEPVSYPSESEIWPDDRR